MCGHNPWLHARIVNNLISETGQTGETRVTWDERPKPNLNWFKE